MAKKKPTVKNVKQGQTLWEVMNPCGSSAVKIFKMIIMEQPTESSEWYSKQTILNIFNNEGNHNWFSTERKAIKRRDDLVREIQAIKHRNKRRAYEKIDHIDVLQIINRKVIN